MDSPRVHWLIGHAYLNQQLNQEALKELAKVRADPDLPFLHYWLALAHYRLRQAKEAEEALGEAIRRIHNEESVSSLFV